MHNGRQSRRPTRPPLPTRSCCAQRSPCLVWRWRGRGERLPTSDLRTTGLDSTALRQPPPLTSGVALFGGAYAAALRAAVRRVWRRPYRRSKHWYRHSAAQSMSEGARGRTGERPRLGVRRRAVAGARSRGRDSTLANRCARPLVSRTRAAPQPPQRPPPRLALQRGQQRAPRDARRAARAVCNRFDRPRPIGSTSRQHGSPIGSLARVRSPCATEASTPPRELYMKRGEEIVDGDLARMEAVAARSPPSPRQRSGHLIVMRIIVIIVLD